MSLTKHFKIHYWPGLTAGVIVFTIIISYLIAVLGGHVYGFFPYVSDTGTEIPESCLFGQLLNIAAVCLGITHYIRYRQVDIAIDNEDIVIQKKWNKIGLWLGFAYAIGTSIVANFQETSILIVHGLGAMMVFGGGGLYYAVQTRISFKSVRNLQNLNQHCGISRKMLFWRTVIIICLLPLFFIVSICGMVALSKFKGKRMSWWTEEDGGFHTRLVSTFGEWIYIFLMLIYIVSFTSEFKTITFTGVGFESTSTNTQKNLPEMV